MYTKTYACHAMSELHTFCKPPCMCSHEHVCMHDFHCVLSTCVLYPRGLAVYTCHDLLSDRRAQLVLFQLKAKVRHPK